MAWTDILPGFITTGFKNPFDFNQILRGGAPGFNTNKKYENPLAQGAMNNLEKGGLFDKETMRGIPRALGEDTFGPDIARFVDEKFLGDYKTMPTGNASMTSTKMTPPDTANILMQQLLAKKGKRKV